MSKAISSPFPIQSTSSAREQSKNTTVAFIATTSGTFIPSTGAPLAGPSTWQTQHPNGHLSTQNATPSKPLLHVKRRSEEEQEITSKTSARFASRLALDHSAVLNPDADTPFTDVVDAVYRLLPYHVFQQPKEDLELVTRGKGKGKATADELRKEIAETKFALECFKRRETLQSRFSNVKIRSGKRPAPDDQSFFLAQAVLEADRSETNMLSNELRTARAELERREKEKRMATNSARTMYYGPTSVPSPSMQAQYYRAYPYAYAPVYGTPLQSSSTSTFSVSSAPPAPTHPSTSYAPSQTSVAIPVQLPVASLPALHALGIVPVPATSLPPDDQPQPPAVLRGSSSNGTMLSLEINVSLLQSAQMSGLAMVLNSLMSRSSSGAPGYSADSSVPPGQVE
ncbi:hypothetical protein Hypma_007867 [Hypsizygus marmoreus]|uniref:GLTSCR protein conserved domain-containing protein n=1 Tax=Hypsizygus marmoreus TaxID=39966 RepID=A0A369JST6_HYPMA|nr:hypothetical protein Hypma_007867 [Hypsizygus marmoreus]